MFTLGFLCGAPFWILAGIAIHHWLDLVELDEEEAVEEAYGADEVIRTTYPQRPHAVYTRNGDE